MMIIKTFDNSEAYRKRRALVGYGQKVPLSERTRGRLILAIHRTKNLTRQPTANAP